MTNCVTLSFWNSLTIHSMNQWRCTSEQKATKVLEAASLADDYVLSHEGSSSVYAHQLLPSAIPGSADMSA